MSAVLSPSEELEPSPLPAQPEELEGDGEPRVWKWTGDDLIHLGEAGLLPPDRKFELLDGEIIESLPPSPRHDTRVNRIAAYLGRLEWSAAAHCREEKAVRLDQHYDPRPDVSVIRGNSEDYEAAFPAPDDVLLVVEVSDRTLRFDRGDRLRAYAAGRLREYWIVNLQQRQLEVYREPDGADYRSVRIYKADDTVTPLEAPSESVPLSELFGKAE
ncbi:MAG: Uma2 family endonuclease [Actinomycetota bacterium]